MRATALERAFFLFSRNMFGFEVTVHGAARPLIIALVVVGFDRFVSRPHHDRARSAGAAPLGGGNEEQMNDGTRARRIMAPHSTVSMARFFEFMVLLRPKQERSRRISNRGVIRGSAHESKRVWLAQSHLKLERVATGMSSSL